MACEGLDAPPAKKADGEPFPAQGAHWSRLEAAAIFGASFALAAFVVARKPEVEQLLSLLGRLRCRFAVVILAVVASAPFSVTDALAIMNGVIFGPVWGSVVNAIGIVLAAVIGYMVALRTSRLLDIETTVGRLPGWIRRFRLGSPLFLIVVRITPRLRWYDRDANRRRAAGPGSFGRSTRWPRIRDSDLHLLLAVSGDVVSNYIDDHVVGPAAALAAKTSTCTCRTTVRRVLVPRRPRMRQARVNVRLIADQAALEEVVRAGRSPPSGLPSIPNSTPRNTSRPA